MYIHIIIQTNNSLQSLHTTNKIQTIQPIQQFNGS